MNILVSWKWLNELADLSGLTPEDVAARVSLSGPGIEKLIPQGAELEKIVVGRVEAVDPHPQADKLRIASVDVGGPVPLRIVCGGSNLAAGQFVPVALIGARVRWHGEGEPVELKPIEIRGVASEGMVCAANEIGLGEAFAHGEREILDLGAALPEVAWRAGEALAAPLGLAGEVLLDSEVTTNRPDALGMLGFAREAAAILGRTFRPPSVAPIEEGVKAVPVRLEGERDGRPLCPRFCAVRIDGVRVGPSPWWLRRRLLAAGMRPLNTIVDITNYVLLELAQPLHAYDAAKLRGGFRIAPAADGAAFEALNGSSYVLKPSMLAVHDDAGPVAVAGVIGGARAAVGEATTSVMFEAAAFDEVSVRRTARALELATDASKLYEKGLSSEAPRRALARAVELCLALAGGTVATAVADVSASPYEEKTFSVAESDVSALMGQRLEGADMQALLERLGFGVVRKDGLLSATVPWWRDHDIEDGRDLVEEIARVYGYANVAPVFPAGISPAAPDPSFAFEDRLRDLLKGFGLTELMGYSFVSREQLGRVGLDPAACVRLSNPLTQEAEFLRPSLALGVLQAVAENQERARALDLFELSSVFWAEPGAATLPEERIELLAAYVRADASSEPWAEAKGLAEALTHELGIQGGVWERWADERFWHPGRSLRYVVRGETLFTAGELHPRMADAWKIERRVGFLHAFPEALRAHAATAKAYVPIPAFPEVERDLAFVVAEAVEIAAAEAAMREADPARLLVRTAWFDTFRGDALGAGKKSLAFHLTFRADDRTLSSDEVDAALAPIRAALEKCVAAIFRG